jgi:hypothetical protein
LSADSLQNFYELTVVIFIIEKSLQQQQRFFYPEKAYRNPHMILKYHSGRGVFIYRDFSCNQMGLDIGEIDHRQSGGAGPEIMMRFSEQSFE